MQQPPDEQGDGEEREVTQNSMLKVRMHEFEMFFHEIEDSGNPLVPASERGEWASYADDLTKLQELIDDRTISVDTQDQQGRTLLYWACYEGHAATVTKLLGLGADPSITDHRGVSSIQVAQDQGHEELMHIFSTNGHQIPARSTTIGLDGRKMPELWMWQLKVEILASYFADATNRAEAWAKMRHKVTQ